ncbi:MAG: caspase family protein [Actinomycetia bacterium]|nr:caspase family protein [Actinomycetes bacterium]
MKRKEFFSVFKLLQFFLLALLLLSFLLTSGCSPISNLLFGAPGSIEVSTYPSGAKIFLNGTDTGYITPYTITNLPKQTYEVKVVLGEISYTKTVIVYADNITSVYKDLLARLNKIVVEPTSMNLEAGESQKIDSVIAYYVDSGSVNLALSNCSYSSSSSHATVNISGTITGVSEGSATITVSYTDVEMTETDTIDITVSPFVPPPVVNPIIYRALLVGVGDYENLPPAPDGDLNAPPYDVERMSYILDQCKFGSSNTVFSIINDGLIDLYATKTAILQGIASTFSGADDNDISYFYFSGHGTYATDGVYFTNFYICPTDVDDSVDSAISINELETALSAIPGTKVVILTSCYSGGFIGKGKGKITISKEDLVSFNDNIINIFSQSQSKGLLTTNQYKVLTSCHFYQSCLQNSPHWVDVNPYGYFTAALCAGCGYDDGNYYADSDNNTKVSLNEALEYIELVVPQLEMVDGVDNRQDAQIYPGGSDFTIVEY